MGGIRDLPPGDDAVALYVHWPFCVSKCPYCDFNSHVADRVDDAAWRRALLSELDHYASLTNYRRLSSVFFGGGTPSLMPAATVAAVLGRAARHWDLDAGTEITLEANPSSVEAKKFADFRAAGVNRLSIGVQAFDDASLSFLGRAHSAADGLKAISIAQRTFDRFSFDLIYARPGHTAAAWRRELRDAIGHAGGHLSLYQLTIEKGTPFYTAHRGGQFQVPDEDMALMLFEITQEETERAGLPAYEVSNHAAPGQEGQHNLTYWTGGDYIGIGPGAHGRLFDGTARRATEQRPAPAAWLEAVARDGHATRKSGLVTTPEQLDELLLMGLRLTGGISRATFLRRIGRPPEDCLDRDRLARLTRGGVLELDDAGLRATADGRRRLNAVIDALVT